MTTPTLVIIGLTIQALALIVTVAVAYNKVILWLGDRLTKFETHLATHATQLTAGVQDIRDLTDRLEKAEQRHFDLAQHLQRLIGRVETWDGRERRERHHGG